jgi:hypothetical protein
MPSVAIVSIRLRLPPYMSYSQTSPKLDEVAFDRWRVAAVLYN